MIRGQVVCLPAVRARLGYVVTWPGAPVILQGFFLVSGGPVNAGPAVVCMN